MSRGVNKVILIGCLGHPPSTEYFGTDGVKTKFSLATDESYNDRNGQKVSKTEWHSILSFGNLAEILKQYLKKGSKVYIEGKLQTSDWEKDGVKRYRTDVIASTMNMLDTLPTQHPTAQQSPAQQPQEYQQKGYQQPVSSQPVNHARQQLNNLKDNSYANKDG